MPNVITRFAPSPTGYLHIGHAYSAILNYNYAKEHDGQFILRIEDIDPVRCDDKYINAIYEDLSWLGLTWEESVRKQSDHMSLYHQYIEQLVDQNLLYPCFCTRKDIRQEAKRSGYAPHGPEGIIYPGTCKGINTEERKRRMNGNEDYSLRLDLEHALSFVNQDQLFWNEHGKKTPSDPFLLGDAILARKDIGTSYHLSVVIDDHIQCVTDIIRGKDLFHATHIHRVLQEIFEFHQPSYHHHDLLKDGDGKRYAKRDSSKTIQSLRSSGLKPDDLFELIGIKIIS